MTGAGRARWLPAVSVLLASAFIAVLAYQWLVLKRASAHLPQR